MIKMCATCKKIQAGTGNWVVDEQAGNHDAHEVSHGFCEPCFDRCYTQVEESDNGRTK